MKVCARCGEQKPLGEFYSRVLPGTGNTSYCGVCKACISAEHMAARRNAARPVHAITCPVCGTEFSWVSTLRDYGRPRYCSDDCRRDVARRYRSKYLASSVRARVDNSVCAVIWAALREKKAGRPWESLVGYTVDDLMAHLERLFAPGMSWDNYGRAGWSIDHIVPRVAFSYSSPDDPDFARCWSLDNLQPLWAEDNRRKCDTLPDGSRGRRLTHAALSM